MSLQVRCLVQLGEAVPRLLTKTDDAHKDWLTKHQRHWVGIEIRVKHLWCSLFTYPDAGMAFKLETTWAGFC